MRPWHFLRNGRVVQQHRDVAGTADIADSQHFPHDSLLRCLIGSPTLAYTFCRWTVDIYPTPVSIYETVTVPATTATTTAVTTSSPTPDTVPSVSVSTVTVTLDHTLTTTDTVLQRVVQTVVQTVSVAGPATSTDTHPCPCPAHSPKVPRLPRPSCRASTVTPAPVRATSQPAHAHGHVHRHLGQGRALLPQPPVVPRLPQPTFPNSFADFHPHNCGTDHVGLIAGSCALTTEGTTQCTLGDYERDNSCTTSDDCAAGWYGTAIACHRGGGGGSSGGSDNDTDSDTAVPLRPRLDVLSEGAHAVQSVEASALSNRNRSIIVVNNDAGGQHARGSRSSDTQK